MKKKNLAIMMAITIILIGTSFIILQTETWRPDQLMAPKDLATLINNKSVTEPIIISVGPAGLIKDAVDMGAAHEKENLNKLKDFLSNQKRDRQIVIYCGCCPFEHCPNIRPAFILLNDLKFTNQKLLNLPHNLKADWINSGYPMTQQ